MAYKYEEVEEDINSMGGLTLLTPKEGYKNSNTKIRIRHHDETIDHEIVTTYISIKNKRHCTVCAETKSQHNKSRYANKAKEYEDLLGDEYTLVEPYKKTMEPCKIRHNKCGYEWSPTPNKIRTAFKEGKHPCPLCNGKINITEDNFYDLLAQRNTHQFKSVTYHGYNKLVDTICMEGHHEQHNVQTLLNRNTYCKQCYDNNVAGKYHMLSNEEIQQRLDDRFGKDYFTLVGDYAGFDHPFRIKHNSPDCEYHVWYTRPGIVFDKRREVTGCPVCEHNLGKVDTELFKKQVRLEVGDDYLVLGEYIDAHTPIKMQHNVRECHDTFETSPNGFLSGGVRCPTHSHSHGEYWVVKYCEARGYDIKREKTYPDLKDVNLLRYDVYIKDLNTLLEYDGPQHKDMNNPEGHWDGFDWELLHKHDLMKNEYAKKHNIPLIRIPYTVIGQDAVDKYLDEKLAEFIK